MSRIDDLQNKTTELLQRVFEPQYHKKLYGYFVDAQDDILALPGMVRPHVERVARGDYAKEIIDAVVTLMAWALINRSEPETEKRDYYLGRAQEFIIGQIYYEKPQELKSNLRKNGLASLPWL